MLPVPTDVSVPGLNSIRMEEGRALRAYQDSVNVWTVGFGLTNYDKGLPWRVQRGLVITAAEAEWFLYHSLKVNYEPDVRRALDLSKCAHPQGALDGGLGFHFNTGGILRASWPKSLNAGNLSGAQTNLNSWCRAGGRVLSDLVGRRAREWKIISEENYGHQSGPTVVLPSASGHETYSGHAELLTSIPTPPGGLPSKPVDPSAIVPSAGPVAGVLRPDDRGDKVTDLQTKLTAAGFPVPLTGVFDDATESAVRAFQRAHPNLTEDGAAGPATDASLVRAAALKSAIVKTGKVAGPAVPGGWIAFHQFVSAHAGEIMLGIGVSIVAAIGLYLLWTYRHDVMAKVNKSLGRVVP